jgi:hypothetical protein
VPKHTIPALKMTAQRGRQKQQWMCLLDRRMYCSPPLTMEREALLDQYFDDVSVEKVDKAQRGWERIRGKTFLWQQQ